MRRNTIHSVTAALAVSDLFALNSHATLSVSNGGFGSNNQNGGTVDGGLWFESGTANWVEGSWTSAGTPNPDDGNDTILLLMDGGGASIGYIYQSLGTVDAAEIALGSLQLTSDFAEKADGTGANTAVIDFYVGSFTGGNGTDINASLSSVLTINATAAAQGLSVGGGVNARNNGVVVGALDITGLNPGDNVWLRIGESRPGGQTSGDLMMDNVTVTAIPEPATLGMVALFGGGILFIRRKLMI